MSTQTIDSPIVGPEAAAPLAPARPIRPWLGARLLQRYCGADLYVRPCPARANLTAAALLALLAILAFYLLDAPIAHHVRQSGLDQFVRDHQTTALVIRWPGHLVFALIVSGALLLWHPWRLQAAVMTLWATLFAGGNWILKWAIGRYRPHRGIASDQFHPFAGGPAGLFFERNLSMPSGDVTLAFALAATLSWMIPRWRVAFFAWAALVAAQRIGQNAHHLSDCLAGAAIGLLAFHLGHLAGTLSGAWTARRIGIPPPNHELSRS